MNKSGTDKLISVYWFAILFIVAAGIVYMAIIFYGSPYDVRKTEANIMINQIADCLASGGKLKNPVDYFSDSNFLQECKMNFNVEDTYGWANDQFYAEINYYYFDKDSGVSNFAAKEPIKVGNALLNDNCGFAGKYVPVCLERSFYATAGDKNYAIKIKAVVGKVEKNVQ
jgi:hypothetical protein